MAVTAGMIGLACARAAVDYKNFPAPAKDLIAAPDAGVQTAVLAGGCFWCTEGVLEEIPGVIDVESGYAGGSKETANYEAVCTGKTGHAEAIRVTYDPRKVSYGSLLKLFFSIAHDPTTLNRQGNDSGTQYRSAIFYSSEEMRSVAAAYIKQLDEAKVFADPIVTTIEPLTEFYPAEKYHQDYARLNPYQGYIQAAAIPKKEKAKKLVELNETGVVPAPTSQPSTQPASSHGSN